MDREKLELSLRKMREFKDLYGQDYCLGYLAESELNRRLSELYTMFDDALADLELRRVMPFTDGNMLRYADDYVLWADGGEPNSKTGDSWLVRRADCPQPMEADCEERSAYFSLAHEAFYEVYTYELPPNDMEQPTRFAHIHGSGTKYTVPFDCVDDGGLIDCEDPRGISFTLTDENGLHVTIEVDARAGYEYRRNWEKGSQYHGLLWVEGYTVTGLHSTGEVNINGGKITSVSYHNYLWLRSSDKNAKALCTPEEYAVFGLADRPIDEFFTFGTEQGRRNEEAFRNFPRWQPYFEWVERHPKKLLSPSREEYLRDFLKRVGNFEQH